MWHNVKSQAHITDLLVFPLLCIVTLFLLAACSRQVDGRAEDIEIDLYVPPQ